MLYWLYRPKLSSMIFQKSNSKWNLNLVNFKLALSEIMTFHSNGNFPPEGYNMETCILDKIYWFMASTLRTKNWVCSSGYCRHRSTHPQFIRIIPLSLIVSHALHNTAVKIYECWCENFNIIKFKLAAIFQFLLLHYWPYLLTCINLETAVVFTLAKPESKSDLNTFLS